MSGVTPTDVDILLAARSMMRFYGRDAAAEAADARPPIWQKATK
jgi:hypothetical protein